MSIRSILATSDGVFLTQVLFSFLGICFSAGMLIKGSDPSIYLPVLTSVLFAWTPSPRSNQAPVLPVTQPALQQLALQQPALQQPPDPTPPAPPPVLPPTTLTTPPAVLLQDLQIPPQRALRTTTRARRTAPAAAGAADNV